MIVSFPWGRNSVIASVVRFSRILGPPGVSTN